MKRPMLVSGIVAIITCAALVLFKSGMIIVPVLAVSVFILYITKKENRKRRIVIPVICVCALIFTISFISFTNKNVTPYIKYHDTTADIYGKVWDTPAYKNGFTSFTLDADKINYDDADTKIRITVYGDVRDEIDLYDYIGLQNTKLEIPTNENNDFDFSYVSYGTLLYGSPSSIEKLYECDKTPYYYTLRLKENFCKKIDSFMDTNQAGLLKGILFGETDDINSETDNAFKRSGISHLLAVSGMHTSLYCGIIIAVLSALGVSEKLRNAVCLVFLVFFSIISSFTSSVMRAVVMMSIILIAPYFKRDSDSINSLGISVVVLLSANPYTVLNVGFQLSVAATLGVLISANYSEKIYNFTRKIPEKRLNKLINSALLSLTVSVFSALFTLPICTYHFGVFSLLSPITNILTVQLSFYATILGIVATVLGFINIHFIKEITIFLFKITQFFIDIIIEAAKFVSSFKFCTVPMHKDFLIIGIILGITTITLGYIIYKHNHNKKSLPVCACISVILIFVLCAIPILPGKYSEEVTVINNGNNIEVVVRSSTNYAYISNNTGKICGAIYDYLPKATAESFKYYLPTYLSKKSALMPEELDKNFEIENIVMPESLVKYLKTYNYHIPQTTVIKNGGIFTLSNEITIEIVDTSRIKYAIIKDARKTVYIHLYGDTNFREYIDTAPCDIAVFNGEIPDTIPQEAEMIILSGDFTSKEFSSIYPEYTGKAVITAQSGDISFYLN